jgi:hypothetical protein
MKRLKHYLLLQYSPLVFCSNILFNNIVHIQYTAVRFSFRKQYNILSIFVFCSNILFNNIVHIQYTAVRFSFRKQYNILSILYTSNVHD